MKTLVFACVALVCVAGEMAAAGGNYIVSVGGNVVQSGALAASRIIVLNSNNAIAEEWLVHLFDASGGAAESISGQVVVRGTVGSGGAVKVQVANASEGDVFFNDATDAVTAGLRRVALKSSERSPRGGWH